MPRNTEASETYPAAALDTSSRPVQEDNQTSAQGMCRDSFSIFAW